MHVGILNSFSEASHIDKSVQKAHITRGGGRAYILVQWTEINYIHLYSESLV